MATVKKAEPKKQSQTNRETTSPQKAPSSTTAKMATPAKSPVKPTAASKKSVTAPKKMESDLLRQKRIAQKKSFRTAQLIKKAQAREKASSMSGISGKPSFKERARTAGKIIWEANGRISAAKYGYSYENMAEAQKGLKDSAKMWYKSVGGADGIKKTWSDTLRAQYPGTASSQKLALTKQGINTKE